MKKRTIYFDYLRVIATFAVVFLHSSAQKWHSVDVNSLTWKVFASYDSLVRWGVPVFIMISGALFLEREYDIKKIYSKYVLRMATAFVFWSILYALVKGGSKSVIVSNMITGHYHMWFIPMICGIYICIPFIYKFVQDENLTKYFLILSFAFAFVFPMSLRLLSDFGSETANILYTPLNTFLNNVGMRFVMGYTGYFVAGYFLNRTELSKKVPIHYLFPWHCCCFVHNICNNPCFC